MRFMLQIIIFLIGIVIITYNFILEKNVVNDRVCHMYYTNILLNLYIAFNSLLTIPQTEIFITILQENYNVKWNFYTGYIINSLLIPAFLIILLIKNQHPSIKDKYKKRKSSGFNYYIIIDIIDILFQYAFSIASAFDIVWGCVGIEICWFLLIIIVRPYKDKSTYFQIFGNSFIQFVSYGIILYAKYNDILKYNFTVALILFLLPWVISFISAIFYYLIDFKIPYDENSFSSSEEEEFDNTLFSKQYNFIITLIWFSYGLFIPNIIKNDYYY